VISVGQLTGIQPADGSAIVPFSNLTSVKLAMLKYNPPPGDTRYGIDNPPRLMWLRASSRYVEASIFHCFQVPTLVHRNTPAIGVPTAQTINRQVASRANFVSLPAEDDRIYVSSRFTRRKKVWRGARSAFLDLVRIDECGAWLVCGVEGVGFVSPSSKRSSSMLKLRSSWS
jgi:hypothetical protein